MKTTLVISYDKSQILTQLQFPISHFRFSCLINTNVKVNKSLKQPIINAVLHYSDYSLHLSRFGNVSKLISFFLNDVPHLIMKPGEFGVTCVLAAV